MISRPPSCQVVTMLLFMLHISMEARVISGTIITAPAVHRSNDSYVQSRPWERGCEASPCRQGKCYYRFCEAPECVGGHCECFKCRMPTCAGGGCRFVDSVDDFGGGGARCAGGDCSDISTPPHTCVAPEILSAAGGGGGGFFF
mmetsp:Transcript_55803/g.111881  ORF Transcript_55803/g.111881 Transcript_55803/m.111881 type:complete len:144 (+) Transcript_55803:130-561(+)